MDKDWIVILIVISGLIYSYYSYIIQLKGKNHNQQIQMMEEYDNIGKEIDDDFKELLIRTFPYDPKAFLLIRMKDGDEVLIPHFYGNEYRQEPLYDDFGIRKSFWCSRRNTGEQFRSVWSSRIQDIILDGEIDMEEHNEFYSYDDEFIWRQWRIYCPELGNKYKCYYKGEADNLCYIKYVNETEHHLSLNRKELSLFLLKTTNTK